MPTYEYECEKCKSALEVVQKFSDPPLTECPKCGGKLVKKITAGEFILKGSGFYVTEHKAASSGTSEKSDTKPEKSSGSNGGSTKTSRSDRGGKVTSRKTTSRK